MAISGDENATKRIAIACQGGGVLTAFTAGVLKRLLREEQHEVVALSGTSGGAVCAFFAWYALLDGAHKAADQAAELLDSFWRDSSASDPWSRSWNDWMVSGMRLQGRTGVFEISPYSSNLSSWVRRQLRETLERQRVDFENLGERVGSTSPVLLFGAIDVATGSARTFDSRDGDISVDAILASASVPPLFRAMHFEGRAYWDGLFCQNPPIRELGRMQPDEIWVIQVTPWSRGGEPKSVAEILDRRNELSGNVALYLEIASIEQINKMVEALGEGENKKDKRLRLSDGREYRHIEVRTIEVSTEMYQTMDFASKIDRNPSFVKKLMDHGEEQAEEFLRG